MTAVKVAFRLKPADLSFGEAFQARYQARVDRPIDDLDLNELFRDVQSNLRPGDWVTIVAYKDNTWQQVMEGCTAIITSIRQEVPAGPKVVRAIWHSDLFKVPQTAVAQSANQPKIKLSVKKEFGGGYTVRDEKGHVIESVNTKKEAEDYIASLDRQPKAVAA
jgi:hypothetical protein